MQSLGAAFEPGNSLGKLVNYVKRQVSGDTSAGYSEAQGTSSSTESNGSSEDGETANNSDPHNRQTDNSSDGPNGLMGGGLSSTQDAGFAFEPGQSLRTGDNAHIPSVA